MFQVVTLDFSYVNSNLFYLSIQLRDLCDIMDKFKLISVNVLQK